MERASTQERGVVPGEQNALVVDFFPLHGFVSLPTNGRC